MHLQKRFTNIPFKSKSVLDFRVPRTKLLINRFPMIKVSDFHLNADDLQKRFTRRTLAKKYNFYFKGRTKSIRFGRDMRRRFSLAT